MSPAAFFVNCTLIILRMTLLLQRRSVIRCYCLRGKPDAHIVTRLEQSYHQDASCLRAVEKWSARFRAGREAVEDDERPERPLRTIFVMKLSDFLGNNLILLSERSVRPSTRHGRQSFEFWTTSSNLSICQGIEVLSLLELTITFACWGLSQSMRLKQRNI
jgi:hypothetical protein